MFCIVVGLQLFQVDVEQSARFHHRADTHTHTQKQPHTLSLTVTHQLTKPACLWSVWWSWRTHMWSWNLHSQLRPIRGSEYWTFFLFVFHIKVFKGGGAPTMIAYFAFFPKKRIFAEEIKTRKSVSQSLFLCSRINYSHSKSRHANICLKVSPPTHRDVQVTNMF